MHVMSAGVPKKPVVHSIVAVLPAVVPVFPVIVYPSELTGSLQSEITKMKTK